MALVADRIYQLGVYDPNVDLTPPGEIILMLDHPSWVYPKVFPFINNSAMPDWSDATKLSILTLLEVEDVVSPSELTTALNSLGIQSISDSIANLVLTDNNYTNEDKAKIDLISQPLFTIILPASSTVAGRCVTPTEIPVGWTVSQGASDQDLLITHNLNTRKIADVKVWSINAEGERLRIGGLAYVGLLASSATTLIIESLATIEVPLRIEIFVK